MINANIMQEMSRFGRLKWFRSSRTAVQTSMGNKKLWNHQLGKPLTAAAQPGDWFLCRWRAAAFRTAALNVVGRGGRMMGGCYWKTRWHWSIKIESAMGCQSKFYCDWDLLTNLRQKKMVKRTRTLKQGGRPTSMWQGQHTHPGRCIRLRVTKFQSFPGGRPLTINEAAEHIFGVWAGRAAVFWQYQLIFRFPSCWRFRTMLAKITEAYEVYMLILYSCSQGQPGKA